MAEAAYMEVVPLKTREVTYDPSSQTALLERVQSFALVMIAEDEALHWTFQRARDLEDFARNILKILQDT
jgi:hypothetical protein